MSPRLVVIDTQSLFDWLLFKNAACASWDTVLAGPSWQWTFTSSMREEFEHVAARGFGPRWPVSTEALASAWERWGMQVDEPPAGSAATRLICTDPDDQKFIDLALGVRAAVLVSRDKALLKLSARARRQGLLVCTPTAWSALLESESEPGAAPP